MVDGQKDESTQMHLHSADQVNETTENFIASEETTSSGKAFVSLWLFLMPIVIILLFLSTKYIGGTLITVGYFFIFIWAINTQLFPFKKKFREVAINAIFHPDSKIYHFLVAHPTIIVWLSYAISSVLSVSMMLFLQSIDGIDFVVLLVSTL
ncbi:MAG TPA: hypothetical protein ENN79_09075, partial [Desulfobacteraceae bacterium]|nr:hypothetical protein [Desulfobacteraceae bacterium]